MRFSLNALKGFSRTRTKNLFPIFIFASLTISTISCKLVFAEPPPKLSALKQETVNFLNFEKEFPATNTRFLGFSNQNTAILVVTDQNNRTQGKIIRWNIQTARIISSVPLSSWISAFNLRLSSDGKYLASTNVPSAKEFKNVKVYRISILDSSSLRVVATHKLNEKEDCSGVLFVPGEKDRVVFKMRSLIPQENTYVYGNNRLDIFDIKTQKTVRSISYAPSFEVDRVVASRDGKSWLMLYYSFFFNNYGEAGLTEEQDKGSAIDFINPLTGKIGWHIASTKKLSVGDPIFFISPQEFISSASIFNNNQHATRPWLVAKLTDKPISEVPGKSQFVVLATKTGFKIRNWKRGKDIKSWTTTVKPGRTFFSPDLKTIAYKYKTQLQFLKFNPNLLKP